MNNSQSDPRLQALLSGYATGNLTAQEREELFTAALADQSLFDALMREEALREMVEQPAVRARLLAAVAEPSSPSLGARLAAWWRRPMARGVTGAAALATLVLVVAVFRQPEMQYSATVAKTPDAAVDYRMRMPAPETTVEPQLSAAPAAKRRAPSTRQKPQVRESAAVAEEKPQQKNEMAVVAAPKPVPPVEVAGLERKEESPVAPARAALESVAVEADVAAPAASSPRVADQEQRRQSMAKTAAPAAPAATQMAAAALQAALQVRSPEGGFRAASGLAADSGTVRVAVVAPENGFVRVELRSGQNGLVRRVAIVPVSGGQTALVPSTEGIAAAVGDVLSLEFAQDARSFRRLAAAPQGFRSVGGASAVGTRVEIAIGRGVP